MNRLIIFIGAGNGAVARYFDRQAGGFGSGRWRVVAWEPRLMYRYKLSRTLRAFRRAGASTELVAEKATADNFPQWLQEQPEQTILLVSNVGGDETTILPACDLKRVSQLYLATHGHRSKGHDWEEEERFLDALRRATRLTLVN